MSIPLIAGRLSDDDNDAGESAHESGTDDVTPKKGAVAAKKDGKKLLNATDTDWNNQVFRIDAPFKLKIASWNVSGLRAWLEKGGGNYIMHEHPDIVCLQETKCKPDNIPAEATLKGRWNI